MTELHLKVINASGNTKLLRPVEQDAIKSWKPGDLVLADVRRPRNPKFHAKFFALLRTGYRLRREDFPAMPFEKFREYVIVMTGRYTRLSFTGGFMAMADSISFGSMDEDAFESLYSDAFDVILQHVLPHGTREDELVRAAEDAMMEFL